MEISAKMANFHMYILKAKSNVELHTQCNTLQTIALLTERSRSYITLALFYITLACAASKENSKLISIDSNAISFPLTDINTPSLLNCHFAYTYIYACESHIANAHRERHRSASASAYINNFLQKKRL